MLLLTKLILAHLIGDFILQPKSWVIAKESKKMGAYQFYVHILLHGLLIMALVGQLDFWKSALILTVSHGVIDALKIYFQNEKTKRTWFFLDQLLHLGTILALVIWKGELDLGWWQNWSEKEWLVTTLFLFLTLPASVFIKTIISKWTPIPESDSGSLNQAGKYIGILERLFVFMFILAGRWEAIGFLVAAKSVFRFGDLRQSKDRRLTEYILIGTLLSFGLALLSGLFATVLVDQ
ncbi:MAG: DUF3307 domain-containing protein [Cyclobacteriaceae bacterium]